MGRKRNQNGSACDRSADSADRDQIGRYRVEIVIVSLGYTGPVHTFTSRAKAERFARAVSYYLPARASERDVSPAWVLVYALPARADAEIRTAAGVVWDRSGGICYLSFDANGVEVKRHPIPSGFYGHTDRASITSKIDPRKPIRLDVRHNFGGKECSFATLAEITHPSHGRVTLDRTRENTVTTYFVRFHANGIDCSGANVCDSYARALEVYESIAAEVVS